MAGAAQVAFDSSVSCIDKLIEDVRELLGLHVPLAVESVDSADCERGATITIKVSLKPADKERPFRSEVTADTRVSAPVIVRDARIEQGQLKLL